MSLHHFLCIWDYAYTSLNVPSCLESETKSWQWWVLKQGKGQWQANGNVWSHSSISQRHNVHLDQQTWALLTMRHQLSRLPLFVWRLQWELNILGKRLSCHCRENITQWGHSIWGTASTCLLTQVAFGLGPGVLSSETCFRGREHSALAWEEAAARFTSASAAEPTRPSL